VPLHPRTELSSALFDFEGEVLELAIAFD